MTQLQHTTTQDDSPLFILSSANQTEHYTSPTSHASSNTCYSENIRNVPSEIGTMTHDIPNRNNAHLKYPWARSGSKPEAPSEQDEETSFRGRDAPRPEHIKHSQAQGKDIEKKEHGNYEINKHHQGRRHDGRTKGFEAQQKQHHEFLKWRLHINLDWSDHGKIWRHWNEPCFRMRGTPETPNYGNLCKNLHRGYARQSKPIHFMTLIAVRVTV